MATVRELLLELGVEADVKSLERFDAGVQNVRIGMHKAMSSAALLAGGLAAIGAGAVVAAMGTATAAREVQLLSDFLDTSVEDTQALLFTFKQFGSDGDDVADALATIADRAEDAQSGMKSFIDDFAMIGIGVDDLKDKNPMQLFELYADAIANTDDTTKQIGAAVRILGDDVGRKLGPMLKGGSTELRDYMNAYKDLGVAMDEDAIQQADAFAQELVSLKFILQGFRNMIGIAVMPVLTQLAAAFREWFAANKMLIKQGIQKWAKAVGVQLMRVLKVMIAIDDFVTKRLGGWVNVLSQVGKAIAAALSIKFFVGVAQALFGVWQMAGAVSAQLLSMGFLVGGGGAFPIIAYFLAFAAAIAVTIAQVKLLALAWQDFQVFLRGGDSLMGDLLDSFTDQEEVAKTLNNVFAALTATGKSLFGFVSALANLVAAVLVPAFELYLWTLKPVFWLIGKLLDLYLKFIGVQLDVGAAVLNAVAGGVDSASGAINDAVSTPSRGSAVPAQANAAGGVINANTSTFQGGGVIINNQLLTADQIAAAVEKFGLKETNRFLLANKAVLEQGSR